VIFGERRIILDLLPVVKDPDGHLNFSIWFGGFPPAASFFRP